MVTRFYHTHDPIANLHVAVGDSRDGGVAVGASWSDSFQWQEKKWPVTSPRKQKKAQGPAVDGEEEEASTSGGARHHGISLCSYVDADNYEPPRSMRESPTTSSAPPPHIVAAAADYHLSRTAAVSHGPRLNANAKSSKGGTLNRDRVALRAHREESFRQMYVVLRISDIDNDETGDGEDLVLASLRFYPHTGLLCVTPGFSVCLVDDKDTQSVEKGPKLSTYRIMSRVSGAQFEYALDNENDLWPAVSVEDQRLLRELRRQEECGERARVDEWRNKHGDAMEPVTATAKAKQVDKGKIDDANDEMMVLLEVVSVSGVDAPDPIRVVVDLLVPDDPGRDAGAWHMRQGKRRSQSRLSRVVTHDVAHPFAAFGHHAQFLLTRPKQSTATATNTGPPLKLSVVSLDGWGRERLHGHAEIRLLVVAGYSDTETALWLPLLPPQAQMEAFFLGWDSVEDAGPALTSAAAVEGASPKYMLSRLGSQTVSTNGRVRVRLHVVESRPSLIEAVKPPSPPLALGGHSGGVMKRSVEEILQTVKGNQFTSRGGTLAPLPLPSPSVTAILARLKDQQSSTRGTSPSAG